LTAASYRYFLFKQDGRCGYNMMEHLHILAEEVAGYWNANYQGRWVG
jgi:hypothetical protein